MKCKKCKRNLDRLAKVAPGEIIIYQNGTKQFIFCSVCWRELQVTIAILDSSTRVQEGGAAICL